MLFAKPVLNIRNFCQTFNGFPSFSQKACRKKLVYKVQICEKKELCESISGVLIPYQCTRDFSKKLKFLTKF